MLSALRRFCSKVSMVDVSDKAVTRRVAIAAGRVILPRDAFYTVMTEGVPKGDILALAEFAGITGAKATPSLIPLCHQLPLSKVSVAIKTVMSDCSFEVTAEAVAKA